LINLIRDKLSQWDLVLAQDEFAYNTSMNQSIGRIPFQVVYGMPTKGFVDLIKLSKFKDKRSIDANSFVESMHEIHE
jgi:hypothetical protein